MKMYDSASHTELCRSRFYKLMEERANKALAEKPSELLVDPADLESAGVAADFVGE